MKKISGRQRSEARRRIVITDPSVCYYCKSTGLSKQDKTCSTCGFPQNQGQAAMKRFIWSINNKHLLLNEYAESVDKARWTLLAISLLSLALAIFLNTDEDKVLYFGLIACSLSFFITWHWSKSKPYAAFVTGGVVFALLLVITGVLDPSTLATGASGKVAVLCALYYGYTGIKKGRAVYAELESIKKAVDLKVGADDTETAEEGAP